MLGQRRDRGDDAVPCPAVPLGARRRHRGSAPDLSGKGRVIRRRFTSAAQGLWWTVVSLYLKFTHACTTSWTALPCKWVTPLSLRKPSTSSRAFAEPHTIRLGASVPSRSIPSRNMISLLPLKVTTLNGSRVSPETEWPLAGFRLPKWSPP